MLWLNQFHPMAVPVTKSISQKWKRYFSAKKSIGTRFSAKSWRETVSWSSLGADGLCQPTGSTTNRPTIRNSCANFFWHKCKYKYKQVQRHAKTKIKTKNMRIHVTNQLQLANGSKASGQDGGCSQFYAAPASFSFWELVYALEHFFLLIRTFFSFLRIFLHLQPFPETYETLNMLAMPDIFSSMTIRCNRWWEFSWAIFCWASIQIGGHILLPKTFFRCL